MSWAIHWLDSKSTIVSFDDEDIVFVIGIMSRCLPQVEIE
jgi:hypothetical protein